MSKLQQHLSLLRTEYVKLQSKHESLQQEHNLLKANSSEFSKESEEQSFASKIMRSVAQMYNQKQYSDMKVKMKSGDYFAHRFILKARSELWKQAEEECCLGMVFTTYLKTYLIIRIFVYFFT